MTFQTIAVEVSPRRIATVRLNRPERGNAFDQTMLDELGQAFAALGAGEEARVVVLRGSGRHFCTGADLAARAAPAPPQAAPARFSLRDVLAALDALPKPTLAVVHGAAVGGGAAFAACCDAVIAADNAFFSIPEVRVGLPPLGVAPFLVRAIGHRNFRRYGLSGERITARRSLAFGPGPPSLRRGRARRNIGAHGRRVPAGCARSDQGAQERGRPICLPDLVGHPVRTAGP